MKYFICLLLPIVTIALSTSKTIIACVGDSITKGSGSSNPMKTSYPSLLNYYLGHSNFDVGNFGVSGATAQRIGDIPYRSTAEYGFALGSQAEIVLIQFGTNDAKKGNWNRDRFKKDYTDLITAFQGMPSKPLVLLSIPPPLYKEVYFMNKTLINSVLPEVIREIAASLNLVVVDMSTPLGGPLLTKEYAFIDWSKPLRNPNDGCHPNDIGYLLMAQTMACKLTHFSDKSVARLSRPNQARVAKLRHHLFQCSNDK